MSQIPSKPQPLGNRDGTTHDLYIIIISLMKLYSWNCIFIYVFLCVEYWCKFYLFFMFPARKRLKLYLHVWNKTNIVSIKLSALYIICMYKYDSCKCQAKKTFNITILKILDSTLIQTKNNEHNKVHNTGCRTIFSGDINVHWHILLIVLNATFSNISAISWRPVLVVEEAGVPGENHRPWASNW